MTRPISLIGNSTPVSLLASIIETMPVSRRSALRKSSRSIAPARSTSSQVTWQPISARCSQSLRTASCSTRVVMMWRRLGFCSRNPPMAQLSDSDPQEVKTISLAFFAPNNPATWPRASSTASRMSRPNLWAEEGLP